MVEEPVVEEPVVEEPVVHEHYYNVIDEEPVETAEEHPVYPVPELEEPIEEPKVESHVYEHEHYSPIYHDVVEEEEETGTETPEEEPTGPMYLYNIDLIVRDIAKANQARVEAEKARHHEEKQAIADKASTDIEAVVQ